MEKEKAKFELTSEIGDVIAKYDGLNLLDAIECLANAIEVIASIINKKKQTLMQAGLYKPTYHHCWC